MGWGAGQQSSRACKGLCVQEQCKCDKKQWYPHGREPVLHLRLCGCNVTKTCNWGGYSDLVQWTTKRTELHTGEQMACRTWYRAMYWWCLTTLYVQWYHSNRVWHTKPITTPVHVCYPIGIATAVTCPSQLLQLLWASTHLLGCASYHCPRLALPEGQRTSATYIVCNYDPSYILGEELYESGVCSASSCPSSESICADLLAVPVWQECLMMIQ